MGAFWQNDRFLTRALLASLVLHLIFAYFIPAMTAFNGAGPAIETISFVKMIRLSIVHHDPPKHLHAAVAPEIAAKPVIDKHPIAAGQREAKTVAQQTRVVAAPNLAAQAAPGVAAAQSTANANATPSDEKMNVAASTQSRHQTGGLSPFGAEEQNPVLDPGIRQQLAALGVHVTLTITVDESGHTTNVAFAPPLANDVEAHIRTVLASAAWDPAICGGGIACEGKTVITL